MDLRRGNSSSANAGAWPQQVPSPETPRMPASDTVRQSSAAAPSTTEVARTSHPSPPLAQKPMRKQGKLEDSAAYLIEKQPDPKEAATVATASRGTPGKSFEPSPKNTKAHRQEDIQLNDERNRPRTLKTSRQIRKGDTSPSADHGSESPKMSKERRTDERPVLKSPETEMERPRRDIPVVKVSGKEKTCAEIPSYKTGVLAPARQQEIHSPAPSSPSPTTASTGAHNLAKWTMPLVPKVYSSHGPFDKSPMRRLSAKHFYFAAVLLLGALAVMALLLANILLAKRTLEPQKTLKQPKENITGNDGPMSPMLKKIRDDLLLHVNQSANPCEDFFSYVCGNGVSDLQKSQLQPGDGYDWNYFRDVHNVLMNEVRIGGTRNVEDAMIVTYKGCVAFMKQKGSSLSAALRIIDVDVQDWLHLSDFATVIVQFVIRAFLAGVPIFLKVRLNEGLLYLKPGDTFYFLYDIHAKSVMTVTLNELSLNKGSLLHDLENADFTLGVVKGVKSHISRGGSGFPGMPDDWNKTLVDQLRSKTRQPVEKVEVSYEDLEGIFQILTFLRKESMTVVRVYTLLSLLVPLLLHDYDRKTLFGREPDKVHFHCVHLIGELFTDFFPHWVARKVQDPRAAEEAERLALNLMELAVDRKRQEKGHQLQSTLSSLWKLHIFGSQNVAADLHENLILPDFANLTFLEMVVSGMRRARNFDARYNRHDWESQLEGFLRSSVDGKLLVVPTQRLRSPSFLLDTEEPSINYGTLGADLADLMISEDMLPPSGGVAVAKVESCARLKAVNPISSLKDLDFSRLVNRTLGAKLAHRYIETRGDDVGGRRSWLFFMRLCEKFCPQPEPDGAMSRVLCNAAALASPSFRDIFKCPRGEFGDCFEGVFSS